MVEEVFFETLCIHQPIYRVDFDQKFVVSLVKLVEVELQISDLHLHWKFHIVNVMESTDMSSDLTHWQYVLIVSHRLLEQSHFGILLVTLLQGTSCWFEDNLIEWESQVGISSSKGDVFLSLYLVNFGYTNLLEQSFNDSAQSSFYVERDCPFKHSDKCFITYNKGQ